jgi:hypothetical protein
MKINRIQIRDFLAISHATLEPTTPCTLIAGDNGQGKSSIAEAIRLALLGEMSRVKLKKELGALVRDGSKKGAIEIEGEGFATSTTLPAGAVKTTGAIPHPEALECCLTPSLYAAMPANTRRAFTLSLLRVEMGAEAIASKLLARGCQAGKVEIVKPVIERRGYQAAQEFAAGKASDARGEWKAHTGEAYGSQKAEGWLPTVPTPPEGTVNGLQQQIDALDAEVSVLNQQIGAANATAQTVEGLSRRIADAAETAKLHARRSDALNAARKALADAQEALAHARAKAGGSGPVSHWPCPECGTILRQAPSGDALQPYTPPEVLADPQARASLPKLEAAVTLCERAVANAERDVKASDEAGALKVSLEEQLSAVPKDDVMVDVNGLRAKIAERQDIRRTFVSHQTRIRDAETARLNAEQTRDLAAQAHRDVEQWVAIAEALQPDGIPGEILAEGIAPMNEELTRMHWLTTGGNSEVWPLVEIAPDMSITYGGRPYALCSESERYRADVMLALVIGNLSGIRFLLLDRVDVLSSRGRVALILLLHQIATQPAASPTQVIAFGTFKEPPKGLPTSTWTVRWIERGAIESTTNEAQEAA